MRPTNAQLGRRRCRRQRRHRPRGTSNVACVLQGGYRSPSPGIPNVVPSSLSIALPLLQRFRVCAEHAQAESVVVSGVRQRFCQQVCTPSCACVRTPAFWSCHALWHCNRQHWCARQCRSQPCAARKQGVHGGPATHPSRAATQCTPLLSDAKPQGSQPNARP
jgi:hypothetical protein